MTEERLNGLAVLLIAYKWVGAMYIKMSKLMSKILLYVLVNKKTDPWLSQVIIYNL